jgi:hypothetical protein
MPQHIQIEPKEKYLQVEVSGVFDQAKAKGFIRAILNACQRHELWKIFVDIRKIRGPIPDIARFNLAEFLAAQQTVPVRMAVFESAGQVSDDGFFENVAVNRGVMVRVSTDLKEVVKWLEVELPNGAPAGGYQTQAPKP